MRKAVLYLFTFLLISFAFSPAAYGTTSPVSYKIHIDPSDLSGFDIEMHFSTSVRPVRVAMAAHPEYDDRYWRYIENFSAESAGRPLSVTKPEDALWQIEGAGREILLKYRLHLPPQTGPERDAWKPFLTPTGGMVGDLHSLMYIIGDYARPARLTLDMPAGWAAASGLEPTTDPRTFVAPTEIMLDAPVMIGKFSEWKFNAGGVPYQIVIWSPADAKAFDPKPVVDGVRKLAEQAIRTFGKPPYRRYVFLFQNGGSAGLEHLTSVNTGHDFSGGLDGLFYAVAHEYFHVWNLMHVRPVERVGLRYKFAPPTRELWWGEGATIYFSDLLVRRAGLSTDEATRIKHLETGIARYLTTPGYSILSAEQASRGDTDPLAMGDNFASTHLQGELLTTMLDLMIRNATEGRRNVTDVMKALANRFDYRHGIVNRDIERAVVQVCPTCPADKFFKEHIYGAKQIDFDHYLGFIGMRIEMSRSPAVGDDDKPTVDLRISPIASDSGFKIRITNPQSAWGKAGLHTGDELLSVDGKKVSGWSHLRAWLRTLKIGDVGRLEIVHEGVKRIVEVPIRGYDTAKVRVVEIENATPRQIRFRNAWMNAN